MESQPIDALSAFRTHRHDVLNHLQLVRAYIQLGRPDDALRSLDALAGWLTSIGQVQNKVIDERIVWMVAEAPHVEFRGAGTLSVLSEQQVQELRTLGEWLEAECKMNGIHLPVTLDARSDCLLVRVDKTEETEKWWHTIHKTAPYVGTDSSVRLVRE